MKILRFFIPALALAAFATAPLLATEKGGMPDLVQVDNSCLPTSTANLLIWFGKHGYPKLILPGATAEERENHIMHQLIGDTGTRYDVGTEMEVVTGGIEKYIRRAGYECDVEYRGLEGKKEAFTQEWLRQNDDPRKGFVLLLTYCKYHQQSDSFDQAWTAGHAVTLVNAESDLLLIHDPAHSRDESGRKIITPTKLTQGVFMDQGARLPVAGLLMLHGSLLEAPPHTEVMLTGAVCITMHAIEGPKSSTPSAGPNAVLAGVGKNPATQTELAKSTWWTWLSSWLSK